MAGLGSPQSIMLASRDVLPWTRFLRALSMRFRVGVNLRTEMLRVPRARQGLAHQQ